jgi:hypothetical protein
LVLESSRPGPRFRRDIAAGEADVSDFGVGRHSLRLEVRLPGQEPYEVEGSFKIPAEVQFGRKRGFVARPLMKRTPVPAGITLPVHVDPARPDDVKIDWEAFLASGGRDEMKRLHEAAAVERIADSPQGKQMRENAKRTLPTWVEGVQGGTLSRKDFDKSVDAYVKLGYLEPGEAQAARKSLDG